MRTKFSPWQIKNGWGEDIAMKYVGVDYDTATHVGNESVIYKIDFPEGIDGVLIHTLRIESDISIAFTVDLMDGISTQTIYESIDETKFQYDQVNVPYKPSTKAFYVRLRNKSGIATRFNIQIRGIEVK
jgi:hypothetical protein